MALLGVSRLNKVSVMVLVSCLLLGGCMSKQRSSMALITDKNYREKLANEGDAEAQFVHGVGYLMGSINTENCDLGIKWIQKSAEQGYVYAQNVMGKEYSSGKSCVKQDYKKAIYWHQKAADQGFADSKKALAKISAEGKK
jgi:TPR repeat protein